MFVMLSVRTTTVHERQAEAGKIPSSKLTSSLNNLIKLNNSANCCNTNSNNNNNNNNTCNSISKGVLVKTPSLNFEKEIVDKPSQQKSKFLLSELNNFKQPPPVQVPVATILNDLSPVPAPIKVKNKKLSAPMIPMSPKGLQTNSPDAKAMRYYRLWIYTCNAVLLMAVIVFCGVAGKVLLSDYKRLLVNGLNLGQPSFIYAYLALLVQSGFLQLIGCLGALRLSEKLLNAYWSLLLVLLIGDAILGIFWMFKFDKIIHDIPPLLRYRLATEYGSSIELTELWDRLQSEEKCCGAIGPQDFGPNSNRTYPVSCCSTDIAEHMTPVSRRPIASAVIYKNDETTNSINLQIAKLGNMTEISDTWNHVAPNIKSSEITKSVSLTLITPCRIIYPQGCIDKLLVWLRNTADILFVIGYCVIAFLKLCFLGILRYEIKEMIQKIKLLQTEMALGILGPEETQLQQVPNTSINGGILHAEPKVGNRDRERTRMGSQECEREALLVAENTPKYLKHRQLYACAPELSGVMVCGGGGIGGGGNQIGQIGIDSDTNSSCALIIEDTGNTQTSKAINGNNNYELSEFDSKAPSYRLLNAPTVTKI